MPARHRSAAGSADRETDMKRQLRGGFGALLAVGIALAVSAPASAQTTGSETINGVIVASGKSGTREVVASVVVTKGVFNGVGRIVEIENLPGDPDNVSRDDLVFAEGSMHLITVTLDVSFTLNPRSCMFTATVQQMGTIAGGTGRFTAATGSFTGSVSARGLVRRNPDGSCSQEQAPLFEVDTLTSSGSLSF
jgi:hypothetical protein